MNIFGKIGFYGRGDKEAMGERRKEDPGSVKGFHPIPLQNLSTNPIAQGDLTI